MSLKSLKPREKPPQWNCKTMGERINFCIGMLYLRGFMTEGEKNKARDRYAKWVRMHTANPDSKHE
jgi:hypothetical protein